MKRANSMRPIIFACLLMLSLSSFLAMSSQPVFSKSAPTNRLTSTPSGANEIELSSVKLVTRKITVSELEKLKQMVGVSERYQDYNLIINGQGTGLRPPTKEEWAKIAEEAQIVELVLWKNQKTSVSSKVDHTNSLWFPPIGDQDGEGSCVTWAVGYYMKTFQEAKEHGWNLTGANWEGGYYGHPTPAYQDRIFSPDFIYHQINGGSDGGSYFSDAINLVCSIGASSWKEMPYDPHDSTSWPSESAWREAPLYRGNSTGFEYMWLYTDTYIVELKNWIASDHLAVIGVDANQYTYLTGDDVWTLDNYVNPSVNHANTIVGYDDAVEYTEEGEIRHGAFKIANSWGVGGWENVDDGCYWISYEAMKQRVGYCMFYRDKIGYEPKLVTSFEIDHSKRGECDITLGMGDESAPAQTKRFDDWYLDGGDHPFCSNHIVFDITEFKDVVPTVDNQSFFIEVYDGGSSTTGTITSFSIEYYHNYSSPVPYAIATSDDPPVNTINNNYVFAHATLVFPVTTVQVNPSNVTAKISETFTINATVANVTDLYSWQIKLYFNTTVLNCTEAWYPSDHVFAGKNFVSVDPSINNTAGYIVYGSTLIGSELGFNGTGTLCQIEFNATGTGETALNLSEEYTYLLDSNTESIPAELQNGMVLVSSYHTRFDFGTTGSPVDPEYIQVTPSTVYSTSSGYGWNNSTMLDSRDRGAPDTLRRDFVFSSMNRTFKVDLPNGEYLLMVILGDQNYAHDDVCIYAENVLKASVSIATGDFVQKVFVVSVDDGALDLMFHDDGGADANWVINAVLIQSYSERKFDFGTEGSPVEPGYTQVLPSTSYSESTGFGWANTADLHARDRGAPDSLRRDLVFSSSNRTFNVDLPNGKYMVVMIIGDNSYSHERIDVYCEGTLVVDDLYAEAGHFAEVTFLAEVSNDQLEIMFCDDGGANPHWVVNSIHVKTTFDLRLEFDFGTDSSPVEDGCVRVTPATAYLPSTSYGWSHVTNLWSRDRGTPDELKRDFVFSNVNHTFNVDLPNGQYQVTLIVGDQSYMHDRIDIYTEGVLVADDLTVPAGTFIEVAFTVTVNDGQLNIAFHDDGGADANWVINSMIIESYLE